mgnify:CR=1 FL=1
MNDKPFFAWLMQQVERDDLVGRLAKDVRYDAQIESLPRDLLHDVNRNAWAEYLPPTDVQNVFSDAWSEYTSDDPYANTPNVNEQGSLF